MLGIVGTLPLEDFLKASCSEIDDRDLTGKTPLAWAASRLDPEPVRILLKYGASMKISDNRFKTPLHYATGSGAPESVELILQAILAMEENEEPGPTSLIEAGDDKGRTPLNYATRMDLYPHTEILLKYGASLEARESNTKRCILLNAIYWNSHKVIPLLLARGARTDYQDVNGASLLHHLARFGDLETLRIFSETSFGFVDSDIEDNKGLTAIDAFNSPSARCSPDKVETRDVAVQLFGKILGNASGGSEHINSMMRGLEHSKIDRPVFVEPGTGPVTDHGGGWSDSGSSTTSDPEDDELEDVFHDASSDLDVEELASSLDDLSCGP